MKFLNGFTTAALLAMVLTLAHSSGTPKGRNSDPPNAKRKLILKGKTKPAYLGSFSDHPTTNLAKSKKCKTGTGCCSRSRNVVRRRGPYCPFINRRRSSTQPKAGSGTSSTKPASKQISPLVNPEETCKSFKRCNGTVADANITQSQRCHKLLTKDGKCMDKASLDAVVEELVPKNGTSNVTVHGAVPSAPANGSIIPAVVPTAANLTLDELSDGIFNCSIFPANVSTVPECQISDGSRITPAGLPGALPLATLPANAVLAYLGGKAFYEVGKAIYDSVAGCFDRSARDSVQHGDRRLIDSTASSKTDRTPIAMEDLMLKINASHKGAEPPVGS